MGGTGALGVGRGLVWVGAPEVEGRGGGLIGKHARPFPSFAWAAQRFVDVPRASPLTPAVVQLPCVRCAPCGTLNA